MEKGLKKLFLASVILCIPLGFVYKHDHVHFFWDKIPSIDVIFGILGAVLLLVATKILASFAFKEEDFYD